jgi:Na+/phosphate symporter
MAEFGQRSKTVLRWFLTAAIAMFAVSEWSDAPAHERAQPSDDPGESSALRITALSEADVNPGDAIIVTFQGADDDQPITAKIAKQVAEVLVREPGSIVVRIPNDAPLGKAGLRIAQGERRSKSWDLHIKPTNHHKLIGRLLGGLALFVYGLGLLAAGLRGLTGQRMRSLLGRLTRSPPQAVGVGMLVGAVTQLTSSAAALAVSLVEARLLALAPAVAILVGAQLGASFTGALLPIAFARESLLVIAVGVLWTRLATGRRGQAVAGLVLGTGLMLYGVHLLQTSVEPLVSDPKLLPYLDQLRGDGVLATLVCAATGVLLALVLQGPGPVYVLVLGLVHVSGALPLANALAILAGTNLGAALGMALIAWQSGRLARPLALPHLWYGATATLLVLATLPAWAWLASAMVGSDASMPVRLAVGFAVSQLVVTLAWMAVLPSLGSRVKRHPRVAVPPSTGTDSLALTAQREIGRSFVRQARAIEIALDTSCTGERAHGAEAEEILVESRHAIEQQYALLGGDSSQAMEGIAAAVVASLQLQRVVEQLVYLAELGIERGLRLTTEEQDRLRAMYALARQSFDAVIEAIEQGTPPDLEAAGAREIHMNQLEAEGRTTAMAAPRKNESASIRLGISELVDGYEHVGNHLFRVAKTLAGEGDDLV